jgi:anaphase-promoting complex subunit 3
MPLEDRDKEKRAPSRASEKSNMITSVAVIAPQRSEVVPSIDPAAEQQAALDHSLSDLRNLALAHYAGSRYELAHATRIFKALPTLQKDTPFVLSALAKIAYEQADYHLSSEYFSRLLKLQPSRTEDMEIYSTVLWHLKREAALSFLCQVLRDADGGYSAPQTWVAIGNAFSLSREHDQAISAFRRATQLSPTFSYAWTLMGHEYLANEAYDSAEDAFRKALASEAGLGYAGWYGLARTYERMGKLADAERYYWLAVKLNPSNSTLLVCVGVVLERLQNRKGALVNYSRALELAPHSSLARFKKARVLMHLRYYRDALVELEVLKSSASDEANVWFLLGKCYKGLGERSAALRCLTTALNLDAKVSVLSVVFPCVSEFSNHASLPPRSDVLTSFS